MTGRPKEKAGAATGFTERVLPPREEELRALGLYRMIRSMVRLLSRCLFSAKCHHEERIPAVGPVLLASTHQSVLDPMLLASLAARPQCFLARDSLFRVPGLGWLIGKLGAVPVKRGTVGARDGLRLCDAILARGRVLVFYPEGTRSPDGKLQPLKSGIAHVARRSGAPVVPVLTVGAFEAWPRQRRLPRPAPVSFYVGPALTFRTTESLGSFVERLRSAYRDLAREADAEYLLDKEPGPGGDSTSTPTHQKTSRAGESDSASLRASAVFSQV